MATFDPAYSIVRKNEGGYVNDPLDTGGETYAGIARKIHPHWRGWTFIDFTKRTRGPIPFNTLFPQIAHEVRAFYLDIWNRQRLSELNSQAVANIFFDFIILHSQAVRAMQQALKVMGFRLADDNILGSATIAAINSAPAEKLHDTYKAWRIALHEKRVAERPDQQKFLKGWLKRAKAFPTLLKPSIGGGLALLGIGLAVVIAIKITESNEKSTQKKIHAGSRA